MGEVLTFAVSLESIVCGQCGMEFAVPALWLQKRRDGEGGNKAFFCPAGHQRWFTESEADRLKRALEQKERQLNVERGLLETARKQRDHAENRVRALKGAVTKVKQRVGKGSCPCCKRHFSNLRRHMASKHPEYASSEAEP